MPYTSIKITQSTIIPQKTFARGLVYIQPEHHDILRRIAYEQRCNISDVLDAVLEQANWKEVTQEASNKPAQRAKERGGKYQL